MKFRNLSSEEIEVRVQSVVKNDKGVILLLYKDARVDQNILDENVTPKYWQKEYYEANGVLFCKVGSIYGHTYEGDTLPEDYICPVCNHSAEYFNKSDK